MMDKQVEKALTVTLERFENGQWIRGTEHFIDGDGVDRYCLIGSLREQLRGAEYLQYADALETLGFDGFLRESKAVDFNDNRGRDAVIKLLKKTIPYGRLHDALDASRLAHAQRDLGKKVPDFAPAAWEETQEVTNHLEHMVEVH